jgi:hypothetical protein
MNYEQLFAQTKHLIDDMHSSRIDMETRRKQMHTLRSLLREHHELLETSAARQTALLVISMAAFALVALTALSGAVDVKWLLLFMLLGVVFALAMYAGTAPYRFGGSVVLLRECLERGWHIVAGNPAAVWSEFAGELPTLRRGDEGRAIPLRIEGTYDTLRFRYFEFDYTIVHTVEKEVEDDDGHRRTETRYEYEYRTESCLELLLPDALPVIDIVPRKPRRNALKLSYIALNAVAAAYSNEPQRAQALMDPYFLQLLHTFMTRYPDAVLHTGPRGLFVNFGFALASVPRTVPFGPGLANAIENDWLAPKLEEALAHLVPLGNEAAFFREAA